jgi:hypothetical protein
MWKPRCLALVIASVLVGSAWAGPAAAQAVVSVSIEPEAKLVGQGSVRAAVVASCDPGQAVLEAHLSVSQDAQAIFGEAGIPVRCDGKLRRYKVTVAPVEGAFHAGDAFASAFVLICADPTCGTTEQGQDARSIAVR